MQPDTGGAGGAAMLHKQVGDEAAYVPAQDGAEYCEVGSERHQQQNPKNNCPQQAENVSLFHLLFKLLQLMTTGRPIQSCRTQST